MMVIGTFRKMAPSAYAWSNFGFSGLKAAQAGRSLIPLLQQWLF